ncbi:hypothetical protein HAX54_004207, partial [Datura stramonium]|nr:hypothetical protein [Datura stramonium]
MLAPGYYFDPTWLFMDRDLRLTALSPVDYLPPQFTIFHRRFICDLWIPSRGSSMLRR